MACLWIVFNARQNVYQEKHRFSDFVSPFFELNCLFQRSSLHKCLNYSFSRITICLNTFFILVIVEVVVLNVQVFPVLLRLQQVRVFL